MKYYISPFIITTILLLSACDSHTKIENKNPPTEKQLQQVPNCAADGPGCKQFNPAL